MPNNRVFVVHGRHLAARDAMYAFLRSLKLEPITWDEAVRLTEKGTPSTLETVQAGLSAAQCTVVLMTGDDSARIRPEFGSEPLLPQPRPNVIFEAGWALALAGQERTVLVRFGGLREFSDIVGLNMLDISNAAASREALVNRLKAAGCSVRRNGSSHLDPRTGGDFSLPLEPDEPNPDVLQRGGFTEFIVDSTLSHSISALDLETDMIAYLAAGSSPNLKYNYLGAIGAQNWLDLSADPTYGHSELDLAIRSLSAEIVQAADVTGKRVDFVSLGPGDGKLDLRLLSAFQKECVVAHYYPLDLSVELLQRAVREVVCSPRWLEKNFRVKAIHGDFTSLIRYRPIYCFDPAVNFVSLIGYSLGNHDESQLLGKIREGMEVGDLLLVDARLHQDEVTAQRPSKEQKTEITRSYSHGLNNRFAFGPLEATTTAEFSATTFEYDVNSRYTAVPHALNIVTYIENLHARFRRSGKKLSKKRLDLATTTIYDEKHLTAWFPEKGFDVVWNRTQKRTAVYLLRRTAD